MKKIFQTRGIKTTSIITIILVIISMSVGWSVYFFTRNIIIDGLSQASAQKARIKYLQTCLNPKNEFNNNPALTFKKQDKVYVCGILDAEEKVTLSIFWLSLPDEIVVYQNPYNDPFDPGYFYSELKQNLPPGLYRVDVYYRRNKLGSGNFTIIED